MLALLLGISWLSLTTGFLPPWPSLDGRKSCQDYIGEVSATTRNHGDNISPHDSCEARKGRRFDEMAWPLASLPVLLLLSEPAFASDLSSSWDFRYFLAGGLCAAASHGATTPIDVVKTKIQADPALSNGDLLDSALKIVRDGGAKVLLSGLGPTVVGYGIEGAAKFGLYESLKPQVATVLDIDSQSISYLLASVIAGASASLILCPMERIRIRLVTEPSFSTNFLTGIPCLVQESGIRGLFSGFPAMLSKQVPYTAGKQISFDALAATLYDVVDRCGVTTTSQVQLGVSIGAAALTSVLACILSHPGDVILTQSYKGSKNEGFRSTIATIYASEGLEGFTAGISARFYHVGGIITSQLVLYDTIKQLLGLPATGSS